MGSQRGWQMSEFPRKELDLILNEVGQDLIYIVKMITPVVMWGMNLNRGRNRSR